MSEWISVNERLPEIPADAPPFRRYVQVLATWGDGTQVAEMWWRGNPYAKTEKGQQARFMWQGRNSPWTVTYWMPMPAGPGKGASNA